ncbi:sugar phosphate nucleotidyltransferase [Pseudodesulfovibrio sp.]|nr:sugar phosphate nucleotidyltransferase [Pseudodesulfovibrio sp.]
MASIPTRSITPLILAGGLGTRLKSVTGQTPKVLAEVRGRPFITYLLDWIQCAGFTQAWISIGYGAEMVMAVIGEEYKGMQVKYSREYERLGTGGGVALALESIDADAILVMNGDSGVNTSLSGFVDFATQENRTALMAVKVLDTSRYGSLDIDEGVVQQFLEKGRSGEGWINAGVYYLPRAVIETLPKGASSLETDLLRHLIGRLRAQCVEADFLDIGTPEDFARATDADWFDELGTC